MSQFLKTIAVDLTPVLPGGENGGAKVFVLELLKRLAHLAPQIQLILLTQMATHEELASLDCPNIRRQMVLGPVVTNSNRLRLGRFASRIAHHLAGELRKAVMKGSASGSLLHGMGVDLLFCPFTAPTYFEPGILTICVIHDLQYKTYPEFFTIEDTAHRDQTFIEACRRATMLVAVSDYSRCSAITYGNIHPNRICTIYHRMSQRMMLRIDKNDESLGKYDITSQRFFLYPANFWRHKNHEMLLTAFAIACEGGLAEEIKLVCSGAPGERQDQLRRAAKNIGISQRVILPGYLPKEELAVLMSNCSGVVFPSLYEGFGLPIIEAMAAGIPVACSNTTSLPEIAGDAAILFDPRAPTQIARAMVALSEDTSLRRQLIEKGLIRASEFSDSERMAKEYLELLQKTA